MLCQICKQRDATIRLVKSVNGQKTEMHLCEECAKKETLNIYQVDVQKLFNQLLNMDTSQMDEDSIEDLLQCENCSTTLKEFRETGKLGCDKCYDSFRKILSPLIRRIHGKSVHTGKVVQGVEDEFKKQRQIALMQEKLDQAVACENYEQAAEIRDMIRLMTSTKEKKEKVINGEENE